MTRQLRRLPGVVVTVTAVLREVIKQRGVADRAVSCAHRPNRRRSHFDAFAIARDLSLGEPGFGGGHHDERELTELITAGGDCPVAEAAAIWQVGLQSGGSILADPVSQTTASDQASRRFHHGNGTRCSAGR